MTNIIREIWNGNLEPLVHSGGNNQDIKKMARVVSRNRENLEANFNEKQEEIFQKYNDAKDDYSILTNEQAFCDGFCLGMKILAEALIGADEIMELS